MSSLRSHIAGTAASVQPFIRLADCVRISARKLGPNYLVQPETRLKPGA
jgi:hypothetical protein